MNVTIFTDGAARGNPDGPGGYGAIVRYRTAEGVLLEKFTFDDWIKHIEAL